MAHSKRLIAFLAVAWFVQNSCTAAAPPQKPISLMGMLSGWRYPECKFSGAEMSDAAVTGVQAIKSKAILTTKDPVDTVLNFYLKKLNVDRAGTNLDQNENERLATGRSVLVQEVTVNDYSALFVVAVNESQSSTTLVISRVKDEALTRIAWSNYRQLSP